VRPLRGFTIAPEDWPTGNIAQRKVLVWSMQTACIHCGAEHVLKDGQFGGHSKVQFKCSKCGKATIVEIKRRVDSTIVMSPLPSFARADASSTNVQLPPPDPGIKLPAKAKVVLTILTGPSKGESHTLAKPRVVLGRKGADIPLNDPEISRHHCLLEVRDMYINLKDMDSTNGTFYDEERVRAAMLQDGTEFRIGVSLIRVNFLPK
jgi:Inner membrane component of T3SS, cytoplasmic domain